MWGRNGKMCWGVGKVREVWENMEGVGKCGEGMGKCVGM